MNSIILPWLYLLIIDEEIRVNTYCFCWELLIRSMSDVSRGRLNIVSIRKSYCLFTEIVYGSPSHSFLGHNERLTGESCTYKNVSASIRMPIGLVYINFCRKKLGGVCLSITSSPPPVPTPLLFVVTPRNPTYPTTSIPDNILRPSAHDHHDRWGCTTFH